MSLIEALKDLAGAVSGVACYAPDDYPAWSYRTYENSRADINELWSQIRPRLKRDADKVPFIDEKISEAFAAFDGGDQERGPRAEVYSLGLTDLR